MDKELSLIAYWEKFREEIKKLRNWCNDTFLDYDQLLKTIANILGYKAIGCIVANDIGKALEWVQNSKSGGGKYSEATMQKFRAVLWDLFLFAANRGDATNVMKYFHAPRLSSSEYKNDMDLIADFFNPDADLTKVRAQMQNLRDRKPYLMRSLSIEKRLLLVGRIIKHIEKDGRYVCLAIMLFTGLRPAEARAICWEDIHPFVDRSDAFYLTVDKILNKKGEVLEKTKTGNGYRRVPIHIELLNVLNRRRAYIQKKTGKEPTGYICCKDDHLGEPVWDYELASVGDQVMNKELLGEEIIIGCALDMCDELSGNTQEEKDSDVFDHFTLYVLRRNFMTWMEAETELDEMEKNYLMGHSMVDNEKDMRPEYNSEDKLLAMLDKMNRFAIRKEDHFDLVTRKLTADSVVFGTGNGINRLEISAEDCKDGATVEISAHLEEPNDAIMLYSLRPTRNTYGMITVDSVTTEEHIVSRPHKEINLQFDNWCAITNAKKRKKEKEQNK